MLVEELVKSLKEAGDAIKTAQAANEENVKKMVEQTIKSVLRDHPGVTAKREIQFEAGIAGTKEELVRELPKEVQEAGDKLLITSSILRTSPKNLKSYGQYRRLFEAKAPDFQKALDSTTAGGVDEWVPTELSANLIEKVRLQLKVASIFPVVTMPTNPYQLPVEVGDFASFKQAENTGDTGQTIIPVGDTANISGTTTFTAVGHASRILVSKEATEDSIVAMLPLIERKLVMTLAQGREDAILNGDTTASHMDTDTSAADSRRKLFKGLRALAYLNSYTQDLSSMSINNLLEIRGAMGVYGANPADIVWVTGIKGLIQLMKMDLVQTLDKIGPSAIVLQGQMGVVLGSPLIISEYVREDLASTGIYGSGETRTVVHAVNKNALAIGERSRPSTQLLQELYAVYGQNAMITTERLDFQSLFAIASNKVTYAGINVG